MAGEPLRAGAHQQSTGQWEEKYPVPRTTKPQVKYINALCVAWGGAELGLCPMTGSAKEESPEAERTFQKRQKIKSLRENICFPIPRRGRSLGRTPTPPPSRLLTGSGEEDWEHIQWGQVTGLDPGSASPWLWALERVVRVSSSGNQMTTVRTLQGRGEDEK